MRAGGFSVQQALTPEAATIVKQSVALARRRGHAQVTPLHVASTMLSTSNSLFRTACLQSHSHPLQCKALELCFNVALNRLPASNPSSPMLIPHSTSHHYHFPSISNALVAAFKRAQAQQRRGSIENQQNQQQQPAVLAVKIELESLIISILDDPSVSRVMREAGFSSTQVKSNVEKTVSLQIACSQSNINSPSVTSKSKDDSVPASSLRLSLITDSDLQNQSALKGCSWLINESGEDHRLLRCCAECTAKFENEVRSLRSSNSSTSSLPAWLQQYKNESVNGFPNTNNKECISLKDLQRKWNSICSSIHQTPLTSDQKTITFSSISPSNSFGQNPSLLQTHKNWPIIESKIPLRDAQFWFGSNHNVNSDSIDDDLNLTMSLTPMSSQPNSALNSPSSSDVVMDTEHPVSPNKFKELTAENLNTLCDALERKVPWQKDIIPEIIGTVLQCRSGVITRKTKNRKEETWLLFQGLDSQAKEKVAKELARTVFSSYDQFISITLSTFSSTRADSTEDDTCRNFKRSRDEQGCSYIERFAEAISINPHRVFYIEDVDQADYFSQMGFKRAIESGKITSNGGHEASLSDAIIILSCESFSSRSRACSPTAKLKTSTGIAHEDSKTAATCSSTEETTSPCMSLDLNLTIDDDDDNGSVEEDQSIDDIGLLESVDRKIIFKVQEL